MIPRECLLVTIVFLASIEASQDDSSRVQRPGANRILELNTSCTRESLDIHIKMAKPFKGIVFSRDFSRECRAQGTSNHDVTLHLPPNACGVRTTSQNYSVTNEVADPAENEGLHYTVILVIQMDRHLQQSSDQERAVKCWLKPNAMQIKSNIVEDMVGQIIKDIISAKETTTKKARKGRMRTDWQRIPEEEQISLMEHARAWMEIVPSNGNTESSSVEVGESTTLMIKSTLPTGIGMRITDCLAHDGIGEASQKLLDESGCPIDELIFPKMKVLEHKAKSDSEINFSELTSADAALSLEDFKDPDNVYKHIMAFKHASTTFAAFKFPDRARLHLTCTLELCKGDCPSYDCNLLNIPQRTKEGLLRKARLDKDAHGMIIDRLEVFNSIEVLAPNIELEDDASIRAKQTINGEEDYDGILPGERTVCLSPSKMALAFCILGLIFLCALVVAFISLIRARRRYGQDAFRGPLSFYTGSKSLFSGSASTNSGYSGSKLLLTDSPCLDHHPPSAGNNWPYGRVF